MVMGRNGMGRNGYGPKWSWAEMVMGRNDPEPLQTVKRFCEDLVDRHSVNNDRCFETENCNTEQLRQSFFVKTIVEWNQLETKVVHSETVESFKDALTRCY